MTDEKTMRDALPHIENALRSLEMLKLFVANKERLSLGKRVPVYYNTLVDSVVELQRILLTDNEYTERVGRGLRKVSESRELAYNVTTNNNGDVFYSIDGLLPLKEMKSNVLFNRKVQQYV